MNVNVLQYHIQVYHINIYYLHRAHKGDMDV